MTGGCGGFTWASARMAECSVRAESLVQRGHNSDRTAVRHLCEAGHACEAPAAGVALNDRGLRRIHLGLGSHG